MTDRERALEYIAIFANVGDQWRGYIPLDSEPTPTGVRIGTCEIWRGTGKTWWLDDGETQKCYAPRTTP